MAQAMPLMLVLFLLFPRISSPLWGMPQDAYSGLSGLSDTMSPGSINHLSLSSAIAFRVKFHTPPPKPQQLYWRGPVLWHYDGITWRTKAWSWFNKNLRFTSLGKASDYTLTLEPHNRKWLYALEMSIRFPPDAILTSDYLFLSKTPLRERIRYDLRSYVDYRFDYPLEKNEFDSALQLPEGFNPQARELAQTWHQLTEDQKVSAALDFFRSKNFIYTLTPPLLGRDSVDEFLFKTQRGFCEHYASAFTFLMRAAGIPARVVTGYQGGEFNPIDPYLIVRQSDAHAWVEVWLKNKGWVRVDPTAVVAPTRIESGIAAALPQGEPLPFLTRTNLDWVRTLRFGIDAMTYQWNQWIIGYNEERQRQVLTRFGIDAYNWRTMLLGLTVAITLTLAILAYIMIRDAKPLDPVRLSYQKFCAKLEAKGIKRQSNEGPITYMQRIISWQPKLKESVKEIVNIYIALRYGKEITPEAVKKLRLKVNAFKV